jgi:AcrR family transcriptional regulator
VTLVLREAYFDAGLKILADSGYGALKLAEVCDRLGVTTGSFYHHFGNWPTYTRELVAHWMQTHTVLLIELARADADPRRRIGNLCRIGLTLPHGAEAAIRSWSSTDPEVRAVQVEVDQQRFNVLFEAALEILGNRRQAQLFANWAVYLLVGYEQATLPRNPVAQAWIIDQLLETLDSGRFASAPADPLEADGDKRRDI